MVLALEGDMYYFQVEQIERKEFEIENLVLDAFPFLYTTPFPSTYQQVPLIYTLFDISSIHPFRSCQTRLTQHIRGLVLHGKQAAERRKWREKESGRNEFEQCHI